MNEQKHPRILAKKLSSELKRHDISLSQNKCFDIICHMFNCKKVTKEIKIVTEVIDHNHKPIVLTSHELGYFDTRKRGRV